MPSNPHLLRRTLERLIALAAALFSGAMIIHSRSGLISALTLADPTGAFGLQLVILGLLANICVLLLFFALVRRGLQWPLPHWYFAVFVLKLLEAASLLPCFIGKPGALCGVLSVVVSEFASPVILVGAAILIFTSGDRVLLRVSLALAVILIAAATASYALLTPKSAEECRQIADNAGRGACLEKFALKQTDIAICRAIDERSSRFECMRKVAEQARRPEFCEEIHDRPGTVVAPYETPDVQTRSLCYYVLAFSQKRHDLCLKIEASDQRERCLAMIPRRP